MSSQFDAMFTAAVPALQAAFGVAATHVHGTDPGASATVILNRETATLGDYGERAETRWTLTCETALGAVIGDTFAITGGNTWEAVQLLSDDGILTAFAVLEVA